jgi:hypothetical protein
METNNITTPPTLRRNSHATEDEVRTWVKEMTIKNSFTTQYKETQTPGPSASCLLPIPLPLPLPLPTETEATPQVHTRNSSNSKSSSINHQAPQSSSGTPKVTAV